jgi:multidrug efflux pump subunit AcrA (membrane-fusion protein)
LARIQESNNEMATVRSPLNGRVDQILATNGHNISAGDPLLTLKSDEQSIWEALRALSIVGQAEDLWLVERYASGAEPVSDRIKQQAALTAKAIKSRGNSQDKTTKQ